MFKIVFRTFAALIVIASFAYPFVVEKTTPTNSPKEVVKAPVKRVKEQPKHSVALPDFAAIKDVKAKKAAFFNYLKPHVIAENQRILALRDEILTYRNQWLESELTNDEIETLNALMTRYKIKPAELSEANFDLLLRRVDIIPRELVLSQAANESAWGTSRFAKMGLNFFGQWCYKKGCGLVPKGREEDAKHEVAAFQSVAQSVRSYFLNINSHYAYQDLRTIRETLRQEGKPIDATVLSAGLMSYSERGEAYIEELNNMIRFNERYFVDEE